MEDISFFQEQVSRPDWKAPDGHGGLDHERSLTLLACFHFGVVRARTRLDGQTGEVESRIPAWHVTVFCSGQKLEDWVRGVAGDRQFSFMLGPTVQARSLKILKRAARVF